MKFIALCLVQIVRMIYAPIANVGPRNLARPFKVYDIMFVP